jgi:hypothetical protein
MNKNNNLLPLSRQDATESGEKFYFTGKPCKHGHTSKRRTSTGVCTECKKIESNSEKSKEARRERRIENRDRINAKKREYYLKNAESERMRDRERYIKNRMTKIEYQRRYSIENRELVLESKRNYHYEKMESCAIYRSAKRIRSLIYVSLGVKKSEKTEEILGCKISEFKEHLERQFTKGMSWERFKEIHIDHIIPLSSAETEEDVIALNHYTNLRPLWAKDNLSKSSRMEFLI